MFFQEFGCSSGEVNIFISHGAFWIFCQEPYLIKERKKGEPCEQVQLGKLAMEGWRDPYCWACATRTVSPNTAVPNEKL